MTEQIENLLKEIERLKQEILEVQKKGDNLRASALIAKLQEKIQEFQATLQMESNISSTMSKISMGIIDNMKS